jgi:hypothetical protein
MVSNGQAFGSLIDGTENITDYLAESSTAHLESLLPVISRCPWPEGQSSAFQRLEEGGYSPQVAAGIAIAAWPRTATITLVTTKIHDSDSDMTKRKVERKATMTALSWAPTDWILSRACSSRYW